MAAHDRQVAASSSSFTIGVALFEPGLHQRTIPVSFLLCASCPALVLTANYMVCSEKAEGLWRTIGRPAAHELQRSGHEAFVLEDIDFGRCAVRGVFVSLHMESS
eukprot:scaffold25401_cov15-Tisochrysis_lutea.AAC.1